MAKDPAFLFYPGDYLRDTQCLSESVQVAYDRIMCEHMRNICISQAQLNFFTKKLSSDEIDELKMVLTEIEGGYQIEWVAESIMKRKDYSESRRKNRSSVKKDMLIISSTYDKHMVNEIENENGIEVKIESEKNPIALIPENFPFKSEYAIRAMTDYITHRRQLRLKPYTKIGLDKAMKEWESWGEATFIQSVDQSIQKNYQGLFHPKDNYNNGKQGHQKPSGTITGRVEPSPHGTDPGKF